MYCIGCEAFKKDEDLILMDKKKNSFFIDKNKINMEEEYNTDSKYDIF
jgi:hypothetical protein